MMKKILLSILQIILLNISIAQHPMQNWGLDDNGGLIGIGYNDSTEQNEIRRVNMSTAEVTTIASFVFNSGSWHPWMMVTDPDSGYIYANSSDLMLYRIKMDGSEIEEIGTLTETFQAWGLDDNGGLIGIGYNDSTELNEIRQVNMSTAEVTTIASFVLNTGNWHSDMMVTDPDSGYIYAMLHSATLSDHMLYRIKMDGSEFEEIGIFTLLDNEEELSLPKVFSIEQNYPNPFNPITTLRYELPENGHVNIIIYDMLGRQVKTLINQTQDAGYRSVIWDATNDYGKPVSAGIYLYQIQAGEYIQTKKMVLLK